VALNLDRRALGRGTAIYLAIAAPCGLIIAALHGSDTTGHESSLWVVAAVVIIVVAPLLAGALAGGGQPSPLVHGALAVAIPSGAFLTIRAAVGLARGNLTAAQVVTFALYLAVFTALGMLGGYVGFRRRQHLA
jgi:hypothetical protein